MCSGGDTSGCLCVCSMEHTDTFARGHTHTRMPTDDWQCASVTHNPLSTVSHAFIVLAPPWQCVYVDIVAGMHSLRMCAHLNAVFKAFTSRGDCKRKGKNAAT